MIYKFRKLSLSLKALANVDLYPLSVKTDPEITLLIEFVDPLKGEDLDNLMTAMADLGYEPIP